MLAAAFCFTFAAAFRFSLSSGIELYVFQLRFNALLLLHSAVFAVAVFCFLVLFAVPLGLSSGIPPSFL